MRATLLLVQVFHDGRDGGRVVLMTSGQHRGPMPGELAYVASKGALAQLTLSLSAEPWGRWGQPDDAARLVAFLCSSEAEWITGQVITSSGGGP